MIDQHYKNTIVTMTGSKNNAGDYLIRRRGINLLNKNITCANVIDFNGWEPLTSEKLKVINQSSALILLGGPSVQPNMYPDIYALCPDLNEITVPIVTMGVGTKPSLHSPLNKSKFKPTEQTLKLLHKIEKSGYLSSVRDYQTQYSLEALGLKSFFTTGCPALFSDAPPADDLQNKKVNFSTGVSFIKSKRHFKFKLRLILELYEMLDGAMEVVFHHGTTNEYLETVSPNVNLLKGQKKLIRILEQHNIPYIDISGSADLMVKHYLSGHAHIGYRVHAHILMASEEKPSILIAEDGRGTSLKEVLGGTIVENLATQRIMIAPEKNARSFAIQLNQILEVEHKYNAQRTAQAKANIEFHSKFMDKFLQQFNQETR